MRTLFPRHWDPAPRCAARDVIGLVGRRVCHCVVLSCWACQGMLSEFLMVPPLAWATAEGGLAGLERLWHRGERRLPTANRQRFQVIHSLVPHYEQTWALETCARSSRQRCLLRALDMVRNDAAPRRARFDAHLSVVGHFTNGDIYSFEHARDRRSNSSFTRFSQVPNPHAAHVLTVHLTRLVPSCSLYRLGNVELVPALFLR
jgi:hypothetical protein